MAKASKDKPGNVFSRLGVYLRGVTVELKRVVWPGSTEVLNSSIVVIATLVFFVAFTFIVDQAMVFIVQLIAGIGG